VLLEEVFLVFCYLYWMVDLVAMTEAFLILALVSRIDNYPWELFPPEATLILKRSIDMHGNAF
jgi:hypothetical protein